MNFTHESGRNSFGLDEKMIFVCFTVTYCPKCENRSKPHWLLSFFRFFGLFVWFFQLEFYVKTPSLVFKESLVSSGLYTCTVVQFGISLFYFLIDQCIVDCSCTNQKCGNRVKRTVTFISASHLGGKYFSQNLLN